MRLPASGDKYGMKDYTEYTDEELLKILKNGDENVMEFLIEKYKGMVRQKARVLYLVGGEQDDLIQEGMIGLFKAIRDYCPEKEAAFHTFAGMCVDRQMYHAIQSSNRQKHQPLNTYISLNGNEMEMELGNLCQQSPETIVIAQENAEGMEQQIRSQLSVFENRVLELYLQGNDYLQIGEKLRKSPKSIDNALQRIRSKVKEYMEQKRKNKNKT